MNHIAMKFCLSAAALLDLAAAQCLVPLQYGTEFTLPADEVELNTNPAACLVTGTTVKAAGLQECYLFYRTGNAHKVVRIAPAPATLQVRPLDCSRSYQAENPPFTYTVSGFVNGEDRSVLTSPPQLSTQASASSDAGTYEILAANAQAPNYVFQYESAVLTITPLAQSIALPAVSAQTLATEGSSLSIAATASSGLPVLFQTLSPTVCTANGTAVTLLSPGECALSATQNGNLNYQAAPELVLTFQVLEGNTGVMQVVHPQQLRGPVRILSARGRLEYEGILDDHSGIAALGLPAGTHLVYQKGQGYLIHLGVQP